LELSLAVLVPRGAYVSPEPRHVIIYHLLTHGQAYANIEDGQRIALSAGDIVVFPHGDPHIMGNGRDVEPKGFAKILHEIFSQGAWRIAISAATGHVTMLHTFTCLTFHLSVSNWMLLILKAPRAR
jgi:Cupin